MPHVIGSCVWSCHRFYHWTSRTVISEKALLHQPNSMRTVGAFEVNSRSEIGSETGKGVSQVDWGWRTHCSTHNSHANRASLSFSVFYVTEWVSKSRDTPAAGLFHSKRYRKGRRKDIEKDMEKMVWFRLRQSWLSSVTYLSKYESHRVI